MGFRSNSRIREVLAVCFFLLAITASSTYAQGERLKLISPAFSYFGNLPLRYTCSGLNVSPPLGWINVPEGCKSLAIVVVNSDDSIVHWLVWNIDPGLKGFPEGADVSGLGAVAGRNDKGTVGYEGPCSGDGKARYSVIVYALKDSLSLRAGSDKRLFYVAAAPLIIEQYTFVFFSRTPRER